MKLLADKLDPVLYITKFSFTKGSKCIPESSQLVARSSQLSLIFVPQKVIAYVSNLDKLPGTE